MCLSASSSNSSTRSSAFLRLSSSSSILFSYSCSLSSFATPHYLQLAIVCSLNFRPLLPVLLPFGLLFEFFGQLSEDRPLFSQALLEDFVRDALIFKLSLENCLAYNLKFAFTSFSLLLASAAFLYNFGIFFS